MIMTKSRITFPKNDKETDLGFIKKTYICLINKAL